MVSVSRITPLFVFIIALSVNVTANASVIKMSNSGLCHPPQSSWYDRTKNYQPFDSLEACLNSGGELPKGVSQASVKDVQKPSPEQRD